MGLVQTVWVCLWLVCALPAVGPSVRPAEGSLPSENSACSFMSYDGGVIPSLYEHWECGGSSEDKVLAMIGV